MSVYDSGGSYDGGDAYDGLPAPTVAADTLEIYEALGPIPALGAGDQPAGWPLLKWLDGIGQILQRITDLADDTPAGDPGWSILLDVDRCPTYALPWLAQWVGVRFAPAQNTDAAQRSAIRGEQGFARGTLAALQAAITPFLKAGASPAIFERDSGAYHLTVNLVGADLDAGFYYILDGQYATYSALDAGYATYSAMAAPTAAILAAIQAALPAGLQVTLNIVTAAPYSTLDAAYPTYSALDAAFATYAAMSAYH